MGRNRLFGTDGIRGNVSSVHLQPENMVKLGRVIGQLAKESSVTLGRDTRASGIYLQHALVAGISSVGIDCHLLGVVPTALMAYTTKLNRSAFGVMISASHNPYHDNGIKIFDHQGFKISGLSEKIIESAYLDGQNPGAIAKTPGKIFEHQHAEKAYFSMIQTIGAEISLKGLKIVMDCANGAAFKLAEALLLHSGCQISLIGCSPDGHNINHGFGSEAPERLMALVKEQQADLGIAFDGDADRVLFVDEQGQIIDGDAVLAIMAIHVQKSGRLHKNAMVATIMSSVALDKALAPFGIQVHRTNVGDKFIAQKMAEEGFCFGGENSGHLLFFPETTTGDGLFSALQFLRILHGSSLPASRLAQLYEPTPRLLKNIDVTHKISLDELPLTMAAIEQANEFLQGSGRVMFRYSGTENKARILVEANTTEECHTIVEEIAHQFSIETDQNSENCKV